MSGAWRGRHRLLLAVGRAALACSARLVPGAHRERWLEEWSHELDRGVRRIGRTSDALALSRHLWGSVKDVRSLRALDRERAGGRLEGLWTELWAAARSLRAARRFSVIAILVFATGIGAAATLLSLVDAVLVRPLPLLDAARVMQVEFHERNLESGNEYVSTRITDRVLDAWQQHAEGVADVAAVHDAGFENIFYLTGQDEPERLRGALVSASFFGVVGALPQLGRPFAAGDPETSLASSVVISDGLWRRRFGGDLGVIGREALLNGRPFRVVAVMPPEFRHRVDRGGPLGAPVEVWAPFETLTRVPSLRGRAARMTIQGAAFVRLADGVERSAAEAELEAIRQQVGERSGSVEVRTVLVPLKERLVREARTGLLQLLAAVGLLAILACVNVAGLQVVRSTERQRELAIRAALGAARVRLMRQIALEVVVLATLGGVLAVPLAGLATSTVVSIAPQGMPRLAEVGLDPRNLALMFAVTAVAGLLAAVAPMSIVGRQPIDGVKIRGDAQVTYAGRMRSALVVAQIALVAVLLAAGGLVVRSSRMLARVDHGMDVERTLSIDIYRPYLAQASSESERAYFAEVLDVATSTPGVTIAALATSPPFRARDYYYPEWRRRVVTPGFFDLLGVQLLAGRGFSDQDTLGAPEVAVINATLARQRFGDVDPVGRPLGSPEDPGPTVIGVVEDVRHVAVDLEPYPAAYVPLAQAPDPRLTLLVRTQGDAGAVAGVLRAELWRIDPAQPLANVSTVAATLRASEPVRSRTFYLRLLGCFGLAASFMALLGVYAVVRYAANARQHELGVRVALGAPSRHVVATVLGQAARAATVGLVIGVGAALGLTRFLRGMLYGVEPTDPVTAAAVIGAVATIVAIASWLPARNALRDDPARALRCD